MPIYKVPTPAKRTPKVQPQVQGIGSRVVDRIIFLKDDNIEFVKPCPPPQPSPRVSSRAEFTSSPADRAFQTYFPSKSSQPRSYVSKPVVLERNSSVSSGNGSDEGEVLVSGSDDSKLTVQTSESDSGKDEEIVSAFKNYRPTVRVASTSHTANTIIQVESPTYKADKKPSNKKPSNKVSPRVSISNKSHSKNSNTTVKSNKTSNIINSTSNKVKSSQLNKIQQNLTQVQQSSPQISPKIHQNSPKIDQNSTKTSKFSNYRGTTRETSNKPIIQSSREQSNSIETLKIKSGFEFKAVDTISSDSLSSTSSTSPNHSFLDTNTLTEKSPYTVIGGNSKIEYKSVLKTGNKSEKRPSKKSGINFRTEENTTFEYPSEQQLILDEAERIAQKKREVEELIQRCEAQLAMSNQGAVGGNDLFLKSRHDTLLL